MLASLVLAAALAAEPSVHAVVLQPLGARFPEDLAAEVGRRLTDEYGLAVTIRASVELPAAAYFPKRGRYRAEKLLDFLDETLGDAPAGTRILGLAEVDISTTKEPHEDWGIFGLGELPGRASVLSSFRLKRGAKDRAHLRRRVANVAVHELGHTLGLPHCEEHAARCVMLDAEGSIANTDSTTGHLGPACRALLAR